jgi:hypothetical protein
MHIYVYLYPIQLALSIATDTISINDGFLFAMIADNNRTAYRNPYYASQRQVVGGQLVLIYIVICISTSTLYNLHYQSPQIPSQSMMGFYLP